MADPTRPAKPNYKGGRGFISVAARHFNADHQITMFELPQVEYEAIDGVEVPTDPLAFQAWRLKELMDEMEVQRKRNWASFSVKDYTLALKEYTACINQIRLRDAAPDPTTATDSPGDFDSAQEEGQTPSAGQTAPERPGMAGDVPGPRKTSPVGTRTPVAVDLRVSADNPFAG